MGFGSNFLEYDGLLVVSPADLAVDLVSDFGAGAGCWGASASIATAGNEGTATSETATTIAPATAPDRRPAGTNPGSSKYFARLATDAARKWKFAPANDQDPRKRLLIFEFSRSGVAGHASPTRS